MADSPEENTLTFIDLVKFRVGFGDKEKVFTVHKGKYKTDPAAHLYNFQGRETQTYILDDVDADIYGRLVFWIYTKSVRYRSFNGVKMPPSKETQVRFDEEVMKLMKLWVLGDKLLMPGLQNAVVAAIMKMWELGQCHLENTSWISYIWDHTMVTSPIRRFVSAHVICWVRKAHCLQHSEDFPRELLVEALFRAQETEKLLFDKKDNRWLCDMKQRVRLEGAGALDRLSIRSCMDIE